MSAQLGNCPRCGKLFLRFREICDQCVEKEEEDYQKVSHYLREKPGITIYELSGATNVTISQIRQFIWSGRIMAGDFPNLQYPCDSCGSLISAGNRCPSCEETISRITSSLEKNETESETRNKGTSGGYISKYL